MNQTGSSRKLRRQVRQSGQHQPASSLDRRDGIPPVECALSGHAAGASSMRITKQVAFLALGRPFGTAATTVQIFMTSTANFANEETFHATPEWKIRVPERDQPLRFLEALEPEEYIRKPLLFQNLPVHLAKGESGWIDFCPGTPGQADAACKPCCGLTTSSLRKAQVGTRTLCSLSQVQTGCFCFLAIVNTAAINLYSRLLCEC